MRGYARAAGEDEEAWGFVALVHDFDYEKYPDRENHPYRGVEILKSLGYPEWVTRAILSHADYTGVTRESPAGKDAVRLRRAQRLHHGGGAGAAVEEHPRSRGLLGRQADEGQGLCARRASGGLAEGRRGAGPSARRRTSRMSLGSCGRRPTSWACADRCRLTNRWTRVPYIRPASRRFHGRFFRQSRPGQRVLRHECRAPRRERRVPQGRRRPARTERRRQEHDAQGAAGLHPAQGRQDSKCWA